MKKIMVFILLTTSNLAVADYTITGKLNELANKDIKLQGVNIEPFLLDSTTSDAKGNFSLHYPDDYAGAAELQVDGRGLNLLLHKENFTIGNGATGAGVQFNKSPENQIQLDYIRLSNATDNKRKAWKNVAKLYTKTSAEAQYIISQLNKLKQQLPDFKQKINQDLYVNYYIKISDMINQMPKSAGDKNSSNLIKQHQADFNAMDFNDPRLLNSGLIPRLLRGYYVLLESLGSSKQYPHMNASTDHLLAGLKSNPVLLQKVSLFLWDHLEKRSGFKAAEHLAKVMLDKYEATNWPAKLRGRFEKYRRFKQGQQTADIEFMPSAYLSDGLKNVKRLSQLSLPYKAVVFWESSCDKCIEQLDAINKLYPWFKQQGVEIIAISLDKDKKAYQTAIKDYKFLNYNDFKGWDGKAAQDYFIYQMPAMFLLDDERKIVANFSITSALQLETLSKELKQKK